MKKFSTLYNSIVIALLLSFLSFKNTWLEMRVNIGWLIPLYTIILYIIFYIISKRSKKVVILKYKVLTIGNLIGCSIISAVILGIESIKIVPAAIIREGLMIRHVSLNTINVILVVFLIIGLLIILMQKKDDKKAI